MSTAKGDHNRVLKDVAREVLGPLGLVQRGRSRTWLDDRGWHVIVVEFQPSGFSKGSYLNVGIMWLWYAKDHISFDYGHREAGFEDAETDDWPARSRALAEAAASRVHELRDEVSDLPAAERLLSGNISGPGWPMYHAGVAAGLVGDVDAAAEQFDAISARQPQYDWQRAMRATVQELRSLVGDRATFGDRIVNEIRASRAALNLPERSADDLKAALEAREAGGLRTTVRRVRRMLAG